MIDANDKPQEKPENQMNTRLPNKEEEEKKKKIEEEGSADNNPDLEDPRLYSPLQEPDRPDPSERTSEDSGD